MLKQTCGFNAIDCGDWLNKLFIGKRKKQQKKTLKFWTTTTTSTYTDGWTDWLTVWLQSLDLALP